MTTALIVDDQANVRRLICDYLSQEGFRVLEAADGRAALLQARREQPSVILLDIMMPEMGGFEFLRAYRREGSAPIILLTAKQGESDKVLGLELGADDYITKPFGMRELLARIRAVLRRVEGEQAARDETLRAADIVVDRGAHTVAIAGRSVNLTPSEFELLATLMSTPGRVYSRTQLLERLQGDESESAKRTIDAHIRNLRSSEVYHAGAVFGGGAAGLAAFVGISILLYRRVANARVRRTSDASDYVADGLLWLVVLLGLVATLGYSLLNGPYEYRDSVGPWIRSVLTLHPDVALMAGVPLIFQIHITVSFLLLAVSPFTRLIHVFSAPLAYLTRAPLQYRARYGFGGATPARLGKRPSPSAPSIAPLGEEPEPEVAGAERAAERAPAPAGSR